MLIATFKMKDIRIDNRVRIIPKMLIYGYTVMNTHAQTQLIIVPATNNKYVIMNLIKYKEYVTSYHRKLEK